MILIAKQVDGTKEGTAFYKVRSNVDDDGSQVWAGSTFCSLERDKNEEIQDVTTSKESDDKIILGYTEEGLPIQIVVDGFYGGETKQLFAFIDTLPDFLEEKKYSSRLAEEHYENVISEMIQDIFKQRKSNVPDANFTMAIAITYRSKKDFKLYTAGFGIGDIGFVLRKKGINEIQQLTFNTSIYNEKHKSTMKDAFDDYCETRIGIKNVIERNSLFCVEVGEGDEIVSYTSLLKEMENESRSKSNVSTDETIVRISLNAGCLGEIIEEAGKKQISLFDRVLQALKKFEKKEMDETITALMNNKGKPLDWPTMFGDDCTIGSVIIPSNYVQSKIQTAIAAKKYLQWMDSNAPAHRIVGGRFSYMRHGSSGKERAETLLKLCEEFKVPNMDKYSLFHEGVRTLYEASGYQPNSLRAYIDDAKVFSTRSTPASEVGMNFRR